LGGENHNIRGVLWKNFLPLRGARKGKNPDMPLHVHLDFAEVLES